MPSGWRWRRRPATCWRRSTATRRTSPRCSTATRRRWRSPSAASSSSRSPGRRTVSASRWRRSGRFTSGVGNLTRAEETLNRALDVRSPLQFMRETTGAVFDTLAQIHLIRGRARRGRPRASNGQGGVRRIRRADEPLVSLGLARARGAADPPSRPGRDGAGDGQRSSRRWRHSRAPTRFSAELIAIEALLATGRQQRKPGTAGERRAAHSTRRDERDVGRVSPSPRARSRRRGRATDAYHDFGQSVSIFELLGERYQAGLSYLELGRLAASAGARSRATRYLTDARALFESLGAAPRTGRDATPRWPRCRPRGPAATSASRSTETTRWCGGSWMPRCCRRCWPAKGRRRSSRGATHRRGRLRPDRA